MRFFTTTALALALATGAASAFADPPNNNNGSPPPHSGGGGGGGGSHPSGGGGHPGGGAGGHPGGGGAGGAGPAGASHTTGGGSPTPQRTLQFQPTPGAAGGQHQWSGAGQHFNGATSAAPAAVPGGGAAGPASRWNGGSPRNWNGGAAPQTFNGQGGQHWTGAPGAWNGGRGPAGVPGANHQLRAQDAGRGWFDPGRYPRAYNAQRRFHVRPFFGPPGWYYQAWAFGEYLPGGWFGPQYYLDWEDYGLPPPPIGCEWVREGADAVLVDIWSGEVLSVDRGLFW